MLVGLLAVTADTAAAQGDAAVLAKASSTRYSIAELLDTNGDGLPSAGDTVKFHHTPKDFTGEDYTGDWNKTCEVKHATVKDERSLNVDLVVGPKCNVPVVYWTKLTEPADRKHERFGYQMMHGKRQTDLIDSETFLKKDWIRIHEEVYAERVSETDDSWLSVELNF